MLGRPFSFLHSVVGVSTQKRFFVISSSIFLQNNVSEKHPKMFSKMTTLYFDRKLEDLNEEEKKTIIKKYKSLEVWEKLKKSELTRMIKAKDKTMELKKKIENQKKKLDEKRVKQEEKLLMLQNEKKLKEKNKILKKKKKDPTLPKRSRNSFFHYLIANREMLNDLFYQNGFKKYLQENPNIKDDKETFASFKSSFPLRVTEVTKLAYQTFSNLSPKEKSPYEELAKADKERYEKEKKAQETRANKTKRPLNPYLKFLNENFTSVKNELTSKEGEKVKASEVVKVLGERWNNLSTEEKQKYL